jgi:hypothetical protein
LMQRNSSSFRADNSSHRYYRVRVSIPAGNGSPLAWT